ncbi:DUF1266 domain-containing protein [Kushneria sp. Sum13]|uniref:DUF1266 domain-containing protein n=1 Tax=Kushneria sp. Sum13 TaxID=3459196 RepID=UPI004046513E
MKESLQIWCAQRLASHGWHREVPPERGISVPRALARLRSMEIEEPGALGWQMIGRLDQAQRDEAVTMLVLAFNAQWLDEQALSQWLTWLKEGGGAQAPWPDDGDSAIWRARAPFAPIMVDSMAAAGLERERTGHFLSQVWSIHERDELIRMLLWLAGQGHRHGWELDHQRFEAMSTAERLQWHARMASQATYAATLEAFVVHGQPCDVAAWDWLRLVDLAWAGMAMGWLDQEEARNFAAHGVDLLTRRYDNWHAVALAWQRGRSLHEGLDLMENFVEDWQLLLDASDSPWQRPLHQLLDDDLRDRSRAMIRGLRSSARHWALAVASVRESDLLYRQSTAPAVSEEQRRQSREYLYEILDWRPEEGLAGLSRFWMPGQVHHLNQLASDALHDRLPEIDTPFGMPSPELLAYRQELAACASVSATIIMAEKYAFHLQMFESADYGEDELLTRYYTRLAATLDRHYLCVDAMLEAWVRWEKTLPEDSTQESLVEDIEWHRHDPGSPFHWLTAPTGFQKEPGRRPPLSRFTALSLSGPLNAVLWGEPDRQYGVQASEIRDWLDSHYGLGGTASLIRFLDFLVEAGDRQEYLINYGPYTLNQRRLRQEIAVLESAERSEDEGVHLERLRRVLKNDHHCNDIDMAAWDIAQLVDLAAAGRQLGWLSAEKFHHYLDQALQLASRHYSDWWAYGKGMLAGYSFFMVATPERDHFLAEFNHAMTAWQTGLPPLAGCWASLDFPGTQPRRWPPLHADTLPGDARILH